MDTGKGRGYIRGILLAGMQSIPHEYYEAASIDGANGMANLRPILTPR